MGEGVAKTSVAEYAGVSQKEYEGILDRLKRIARVTPQKIAICDESGNSQTYSQLISRVVDIEKQLREKGLKPGIRVACIVPPGVTGATISISMMCYHECVVIDPKLPILDIVQRIQKMRAQAVVWDRDKLTQVYGELTRLLVVPLEDISMDCSAEDFQDLEFVTDEGRLALIVGTSGTTATPKIIPLSEKRLILATENMQNIFDLTADDICFCPMPLYHTHGLVTGLLSALCSGGSIMCVAKFDPRQMLDLVADIKATWVTAAPAIYQSVLKVAAQNSQMHAKTGLRFVRSSSAALPASVMKTIEAFFRAPVIETYGITEASVVASNPLPPADRKAGSVGFPTNVDIKIMRSKSDSKSGEICLRGPIVIDGYECNSAANDVSFSDGWFLTGDLGYFDQNGYLFLIGRKGDSIKRGANLVALADIDSALIELDELSDGAAYKVAHQTLGNDIRAAVVVTAGCEIDGPEIRSKLLKSLPAYKVPSHIDVVDEIPRSATGKILRGILAELLAANVDERATPPSTEIQKEIASIWEDMLEVENVGLEDDFFSAGGDSLNLIIFLETVSERYGIELGPEEFLETPQLLAIADLIDCLQKSKTGN